jgi:hypothetical protein
MDTLAPEKEPKGPVLGIIVIIILLVIGGIYIFMNESNSLPGEMASTTPEAAALGPESTSTDPATIQAEVEATNLDSLDSELRGIADELNAQ